MNDYEKVIVCASIIGCNIIDEDMIMSSSSSTSSSSSKSTSSIDTSDHTSQVCQSNSECQKTEVCSPDLDGLKCRPLENYDYKIQVTHFEPFDWSSGFVYFKIISRDVFTSSLSNYPFDWSDDILIYKLNNNFQIEFIKDDPFGNIILGKYCFDDNCGPIVHEVIHEGKFFGIDDKQFGRFMLKIVPGERKQ